MRKFTLKTLLAVLLALPAMVYVAVRLSSQHRHVSRLRRTLGDLMVSTAVLAAAMAATGPELGRPLDRLTVITVVDRQGDEIRTRTLDAVRFVPFQRGVQ